MYVRTTVLLASPSGTYPEGYEGEIPDEIAQGWLMLGHVIPATPGPVVEEATANEESPKAEIEQGEDDSGEDEGEDAEDDDPAELDDSVPVPPLENVGKFTPSRRRRGA